MTTLSPIYDIAGLVDRLHLDNDLWIRRHINSLPHSKIGDARLFTEEDVARILALTHHEPAEKPQATRSRRPSDATQGSLTPLPRRARSS